jgi:hypothetical protein
MLYHVNKVSASRDQLPILFFYMFIQMYTTMLVRVTIRYRSFVLNSPSLILLFCGFQISTSVLLELITVVKMRYVKTRRVHLIALVRLDTMVLDIYVMVGILASLVVRYKPFMISSDVEFLAPS